MHWLLIGYMFLFIHRPFEVWPVLDDMRLERVYVALMACVWLVSPKRWLPNFQHTAIAAFAFAIAGCWLLSPWADQGQGVVENWFKILVFYVLLVTTVYNAAGLRRVTLGFLAVMGLYMTHSLWEFMGGRHMFRMGIVRLIGVDTSLGDPNSFGASILFAMPFARAFWLSGPSFKLRAGLLAYVGLSTACILLTGSRSSFLGLLVWAGLTVLMSRRRFLGFAVACLLAPVVFLSLPESLQNRFETIINPDVGPANAAESGQGRIIGFLTGLELFAEYPATGVGPGAWRPATGSELESHNLIGQLLGEMGLAGVLSFGAILLGFAWNGRQLHRQRRKLEAQGDGWLARLNGAVMMSVFLLLLEGNFGHNLYRHNWLWFAGFLIIARTVATKRLRRPKFQAFAGRMRWPIATTPVERYDVRNAWRRNHVRTTHR